MPDAVVVDNLFGRNSLDKTVAVVKYGRRKMKFYLPGFENGYAVESVDWRDSIIYRETINTAVELKPGIYLLMSPEYQDADSIRLHSKVKIDWDVTTPLPDNSNQTTQSYKSGRVRSIEMNTSSNDPINLFDAGQDVPYLNRRWIPDSEVKKDSISGYSYLKIKLKGLTSVDPENQNAIPIADYTMRHYFGDIIKGRENDLPEKKTLVLNAYSHGDFNLPVQISIVMKDGSAFGAQINLNSVDKTYKVNLNDLKRVSAVLMPRPYPTFLPYYSSAGKADHLDISQIESLEISIGPGIKKEDLQKEYVLFISSVSLE
jgi:hypothetical protein